MIRARALLLRKSLARREIRSLATTSTARSIGAAATSTEWTSHHGSMSFAAAAVGALMVASSLSQESSDDRSSRVSLCNPSSLVQCQCESALNEDENSSSSSSSNGPIKTISAQEISTQSRNHDIKSLRAYQSAIANDLFRDEIKSESALTPATPSAYSNNNAITSQFVSFSPPVQHVNIRPRVTVRHTHRRSNTDDDVGGDGDNVNEEGVEEEPLKLLATSTTDQEAPPTVKSYNTTLGTIPNTNDTTEETDNTNNPTNNKEVILQKLKTCRRTHHSQVYTKNMYFYKNAHLLKPSVRSKFRLFALPSSQSLGKEMAFLLDTTLNSIDVGSYTDGETSVQILEAVRGKNIFVVCTTTSATSITELLLTLSALRRGSAKRINVILPYYGYSRQDRRTGMKREPIAAADMAYLLEEMGVDSVICVDLHNALVKGFFSPMVPVDHLSPGPVAAAYFYEELWGVGCDGESDEEGNGEKEKEEEVDEKKKEAPKITVVAAHENQVSRANVFRNALMKLSGSDDIRVALISNSRALNENTMSDNAQIVGDVDGRQCIIVDDIITTGSTMIKAINAVHNAGASEIYAWATHGVRHNENNVPHKLSQIDGLKYLLISNSVAEDETAVPCSKIRKLSIAPLLSEAVARALNHESIRTILDMKLIESDK